MTKLIAGTFGRFKNIPFVPILLDEQMKIFTLFFKPKVFSNMINITQWIKNLEGVSTKYHKYGGIEFRVDQKEICHMHGDGLIDVMLNKELKEQFLHCDGVEAHHVSEGANMISYQLTKEEDLSIIKNVIFSAYLNIKNNQNS